MKSNMVDIFPHQRVTSTLIPLATLFLISVDCVMTSLKYSFDSLAASCLSAATLFNIFLDAFILVNMSALMPCVTFCMDDIFSIPVIESMYNGVKDEFVLV